MYWTGWLSNWRGRAELARDDVYTLKENNVSVHTFDILSNDLGGAGKSLLAIAEGDEDRALARLAKGGATTSFFSSRTGALVSIGADGKLHYDTTVPGAMDIDRLAAGETLTETFSYVMRVGSGLLSVGETTIRIVGSNDAPVAQSATAEAIRNGPAITGAVVATDVDHGAVLTYSLTAPAPAGLTFASNGAWSFNPAGASGDVVVSYVAKDQWGASSKAQLTIHVINRGSPPVASAFTAEAVEDGDVVTGAVVATDPDPGDTLTYSLVGAAPGGFALHPDGSWSFDPSDPAWRHLAADATQDVVVKWRATDPTGASVDSTLTIHVTGVNDAAGLSGDDTGAVKEDTITSVGGVLHVTDADDGEQGFRAGSIAGDYGTLIIEADGTWTYVLDPTLANPLRSGETALDVITVRTIDGTSHDIKITVEGLDETPPVWTGDGDPTDAYRDTSDYPTTELTGTDGADMIYGADGADAIASGDGGDWVFGRGGDDAIVTGAGVDFIYGQRGNDTIDAGAGDDWIYGGSGADDINGADGADWIYGGFGADTLRGGAGADRFAYYGLVEETGDTIADFEVGVDKIDLLAFHVTADQVSWALRDGDTVIKLDLGGGPDPEFEIRLTGAVPIGVGDFYL